MSTGSVLAWRHMVNDRPLVGGGGDFLMVDHKFLSFFLFSTFHVIRIDSGHFMPPIYGLEGVALGTYFIGNRASCKWSHANPKSTLTGLHWCVVDYGQRSQKCLFRRSWHRFKVIMVFCPMVLPWAWCFKVWAMFLSWERLFLSRVVFLLSTWSLLICRVFIVNVIFEDAVILFFFDYDVFWRLAGLWYLLTCRFSVVGMVFLDLSCFYLEPGIWGRREFVIRLIFCGFRIYVVFWRFVYLAWKWC